MRDEFAPIGSFFKKLSLLFYACRGYSTPTSIMSWLIPFAFGLINEGSIWFGTLSILGVLAVHLATNIFDDAIDYSKELIDIKRGLKEKVNLQKGKCAYILNGDISLKASYFVAFTLFSIGLIIGIFFLFIWGTKLLYIIIPTGILCLLYPLLGSLGLGEIIVGTIYSVFLYSGVYFVMTGTFSRSLICLSISTGLLVITVLFNHMLLDYKIDENNRKITLCRLCRTQKNALILMGIIIFFAYINILFLLITKQISPLYIITFLSLPHAITLIKVMNTHINSPEKEIKHNIFMTSKFIINKVPIEQRSFIIKFLLSENLLCSFTILLLLAIIFDRILKCIL